MEFCSFARIQMGRVIAIDYGLKRCGIAVTDEQQNFAFPLDTVATNLLHEFLQDYCSKNEVDGFVVGLPLRNNNTATHSTPHIEGFVKRLLKQFPQKSVYRIDERFTSVIAKRTLVDAGLKKSRRQDKSLVDKVSATIILQSWIESQSRL